MFRINPGDAQTSLYGIGKGAAQVIDLSPLREQAAQEANRNFAAKQAKERADAQQEAQVQDQIAKMASVKIMPKDQELIAGKLQGVRDYVVKNNGMKDASPAQMMEFQKLIGDAKIAADQSQNFREAWEQRGLEVMQNQQKYRPEAIEQHWKMSLPETAGQWTIDDSMYKQKFDADTYVNKLADETKQWANSHQKAYSETFTLKQAEDRIGEEINSNPLFADEMIYRFNKAEDKMGATTAAEYAKKLYAPRIDVNVRKAVPQGSGGTDNNKGKVLLNWTTREDGTKYATISIGGRKPTPVTIEDPKNPGYSVTYQPMEYIQRVNPETKKEEIVLKATNTKTNKIEYLDYNTAQNTLFHGYQIENPKTMMDRPEEVARKTKGYDLREDKGNEVQSKIKINNKDYNVSKETKGYQVSKDGKKAKITYSDGTTEVIIL